MHPPAAASRPRTRDAGLALAARRGEALGKDGMAGHARATRVGGVAPAARRRLAERRRGRGQVRRQQHRQRQQQRRARDEASHWVARFRGMVGSVHAGARGRGREGGGWRAVQGAAGGAERGYQHRRTSPNPSFWATPLPQAQLGLCRGWQQARRAPLFCPACLAPQPGAALYVRVGACRQRSLTVRSHFPSSRGGPRGSREGGAAQASG